MGVIKTVVERIPLLKQLFAMVDGHKANIGRALMFISALMVFLHSPEGWPELFVKFPILETVNGYYSFVAGWLLSELGLQHDVVKEMDAEGVVEDHDL